MYDVTVSHPVADSGGLEGLYPLATSRNAEESM